LRRSTERCAPEHTGVKFRHPVVSEHRLRDSFGGRADVQIDLQSTTFDTVLQIHDGACTRQFASDDDGGGNRNARLKMDGSVERRVCFGCDLR